MTVELTNEDRQRIRGAILGKYAKVAQCPDGLFGYPTGLRGLQSLQYDESIIGTLPKETLEFFCGVGNPFSVGTISEGSSVLDVGCGAGIDAMVAAKMTGRNGHVTGLDLSLDMLQRARRGVLLANLENVSFERASAEDLPFADDSFDVVISSGALNLVPNKTQSLDEIFRVMKPGARLMMADQALTECLPADTNRVDDWAGWLGGSMPGMDFLDMLKGSGFVDVRMSSGSGFKSSPSTEGVLFSASKPMLSGRRSEENAAPAMESYKEFMEMAYVAGAIDRKTKYLIGLSASLAAGCDP